MPSTLEDFLAAIAVEKDRAQLARKAAAEARDALTNAQAEELRAESRIVALEAAARELVHGSPLHNPRKSASVNLRMDTQKHAGRPRGQKLQTKHVGAARIRKVDGSINAFALKHGEKPTTVYGWYATGSSARKIPERWAEKLTKPPYSIPRSAWINGISTDGE